MRIVPADLMVPVTLMDDVIAEEYFEIGEEEATRSLSAPPGSNERWVAIARLALIREHRVLRQLAKQHGWRTPKEINAE